MRRRQGVVACGHAVTRDAAVHALEAGGNAFDAAAAAVWAACVAEPLLASPGGGGFLLARPAGHEPRIYDFFAQTPGRRLPPGETDFREIFADFGPATQPFQIGLGSMAVPGVVAGCFDFQRALGRMPMRELVQPAVAAAREGVRVNRMQAYAASILNPIVQAGAEARAIFAPAGAPVAEGDLHCQPALAGFLETLAAEGEGFFYRGAVAEAVDRACREGGGHLRREDFERYEVICRQPLETIYRDCRVLTNPPPASGGVLVAFGLAVLTRLQGGAHPLDAAEAGRMVAALSAIQQMRRAEGLDEAVDAAAAARVLAPELVARYREAAGHPPAARGTTHISVIDGEGQAASLSFSNGEGCGWIVPGTGVMLNNMLGEADLLPRGFGQWPAGIRLTSMMAPTMVEPSDRSRLLVLGSGGSSRIRSAILHVLAGSVDFGLSLEAAVDRPRLQLEGDRLDIEGGFDPDVVAALAGRWQNQRVWPGRNLYFGGVHAVERTRAGFAGAGDARRNGAAAVLA